MTNWTSKKLGWKCWETGRGSFWLSMEEERRAVEELAFSWLNLINSVGGLSWTAPKQSRRGDPPDDGTN